MESCHEVFARVGWRRVTVVGYMGYFLYYCNGTRFIFYLSGCRKEISGEKRHFVQKSLIDNCQEPPTKVGGVFCGS